MTQPLRQKRLALLTAALLLLSSALVTAHAFGEVAHAVKDGCQLIHQVERQQHAPATVAVQADDTRRFDAPADPVRAGRLSTTTHSFRSRAPPLV